MPLWELDGSCVQEGERAGRDRHVGVRFALTTLDRAQPECPVLNRSTYGGFSVARDGGMSGWAHLSRFAPGRADTCTMSGDDNDVSPD